MDIVSQQSLILKCDYHNIEIQSLIIHMVDSKEKTIMTKHLLPALGCVKFGGNIYKYVFHSDWDIKPLIGAQIFVSISTNNITHVELFNMQSPLFKSPG